MSSSGEFVSVASSVDVRGSEGVRVGSVGSAIDLSDGDVLVSASSTLDFVSGDSVSVSAPSATVSVMCLLVLAMLFVCRAMW